MGWDEKVILVAGVGPGLGSAVTHALAGTGAAVVAVARSRPALDALESAARSRRWRLRTFTADLRTPSGIDAVVEATVAEFGRLDAACITAGRWSGAEHRLHELTEAEWSDVLRDNLEPVYRVGRAALPPMLRQKDGALVIVSASEEVRFRSSAAYAAAKAGLIELARKLAADYRPSGIRVNAILPGNMGREAPPDPPPASGVVLRDSIPTAPWEVARAVRYLVSDDARWVTGAALAVDGGLSIGGVEPSERSSPPS